MGIGQRPRQEPSEATDKGKEVSNEEVASDDEDDENLDPKALLEKWKIKSLAKLREETKRGIDLMKNELNQEKERELGELRKEIDILKRQLIAEKSSRDRSKRRETIEREVQLQTELTKRKEEVVTLQDRLAKLNKVPHISCTALLDNLLVLTDSCIGK